LGDVKVLYNIMKKQHKDVLVPLSESARVVPSFDEKTEKFSFLDQETNQRYIPTKHCLSQLSQKFNIGSHALNQYLKRPEADCQLLLRDLFRIHWKYDSDNKNYLFRLNDSDGTARAFLSEKYAIINNDWVLDQVEKYLPKEALGQVAHNYSTGDFINFQVFIPQTQKMAQDSEYGGLIQIENSEIGTHRLKIEAGVLRLICTNGATGFSSLSSINMVHRGKVDLNSIGYQLQSGIQENILKMDTLINKFLNLKQFALAGDDGANMTPLYATVADVYRLNNQEIEAVHTGFGIESNETPENTRTLFGVANTMTRAAQLKLPEPSWKKLNDVGGQLAEYQETDWKVLVAKSKAMTTNDVEKVLGKDLIFA